jgi:hypothetical protein
MLLTHSEPLLLRIGARHRCQQLGLSQLFTHCTFCRQWLMLEQKSC